MSDIVKAETDRLNIQKQSIDDALNDKRRLIILNDSYRKRMTSYTFIAMGITAGALCMLAISFLPIPTIFSNILYVFVIMGVFILIIYRYDIISQRSRLDYDELNLPSIGKGEGKLSDENKQEQQRNAQESGKLSDSASLTTPADIKDCRNKDCCPLTWSDITGCPNDPSLLSAGNVSAFTTLSDAYSSRSSPMSYEYHSPSSVGLDTYESSSGIQYTPL
jgi:hypothetical protein